MFYSSGQSIGKCYLIRISAMSCIYRSYNNKNIESWAPARFLNRVGEK